MLDKQNFYGRVRLTRVKTSLEDSLFKELLLGFEHVKKKEFLIANTQMESNPSGSPYRFMLDIQLNDQEKIFAR